MSGGSSATERGDAYVSRRGLRWRWHLFRARLEFRLGEWLAERRHARCEHDWMNLGDADWGEDDRYRECFLCGCQEPGWAETARMTDAELADFRHGLSAGITKEGDSLRRWPFECPHGCGPAWGCSDCLAKETL